MTELVYVSEWFDNCISVFNSEGNFLARVDSGMLDVSPHPPPSLVLPPCSLNLPLQGPEGPAGAPGNPGIKVCCYRHIAMHVPSESKPVL